MAPGRLLAVAVVFALGGAACSSTDADPRSGPDSRPSTSTTVPADEPTRTSPWSTVGPSTAGFDTAMLLDGVELLETDDSNVHALVVLRADSLVVDAAVFPYTDDVPHDVASVTKSITALVVGAAIGRGDLEGLGQPLGELLDEAAGQPVGEVTIGELLGMRSGLACGLAGGEPELLAMLGQADYVDHAVQLPPQGAAGERFAYCSPGYHLVSAAVSAATGRSLADYADEVLFGPLGIEDWSWTADDSGVSHGWGDLSLRPTDLARIGQLVLDRGEWDGREVVPPSFVGQLGAEPLPADPGFEYGLGWWLPSTIGEGVLMARGRGGQVLLVWPEEQLVVVGTGAGTDGAAVAEVIVGALTEEPGADGDDLDDELETRLLALLEPPDPHPPTEAGAGASLDVPFELEPNALGIERVVVSASTAAEAVLSVVIAGREYQMPVGLDGVPRVARATPVDAPIASVGDWTGNSLRADLEQVDGPNHWVFDIDLGEVPAVAVTDLTGLFPDFVVAGTPAGTDD